MEKSIKLKVISVFLAMILCLQMFTVEIYQALEVPELYSGAYALTDGSTDRVLLGKNADDPMANASTTKILTCIVTLENTDLNDMVTISQNAQNQPKVRLGMGEKEQYPLRDLVYGLMLESYNDCAVAIAEHVAGSEEAFAKLLNEKAKEIGCNDTYFITPNGLDESDEGNFHHTTASDLCRMMAYCVWESPKKDDFLQITQTTAYQGTNGKNSYSFTNKNAFLNQMEGVLSGKTGFTAKAGYCYVAALEKDGEKYCIALLACGWPNNKNYKWHDAKELFTYGLKNYDNAILKEDLLKERITIDGYAIEPTFLTLNKKMEICLSGKMEAETILLNQEELVTKKVILSDAITLPISKGEKLGQCEFYVGEYLITTVPLLAECDGDEWDFWKVFQAVFRQYVDF